MEANKVYISCPMSVKQDVLDTVEYKLGKMGYQTYYCERGSRYSNSPLLFSHIVVFILPHNNFAYEIDDLSAGIYKEIQLAKKENKRTYIAYKSKTTGNYQIYRATIDTHSINGVAGDYLEVFISNSKPVDYKKQEPELLSIGNTILLLG